LWEEFEAGEKSAKQLLNACAYVYCVRVQKNRERGNVCRLG